MNIPDEVLPCVCGHQKHSHELTDKPANKGCYGCFVAWLDTAYHDTPTTAMEYENICKGFVLDNLKLCEIAHNRKEIPFEDYRNQVLERGYEVK